LWVRVPSTPSTWLATVVSSGAKMLKWKSRNILTISSLYQNVQSPLASVDPNNISWGFSF
jgi:hypothetical protein